MAIDPKHVITLGQGKDAKDYPLWVGILAEAHSRGLQSIETSLIQIPGPDNDHTAIVKAVVTMKDGSRFEDYGDASPRNVGSRIQTALIRMASTRSKGRALRDAINVGQTMAEELPDLSAEDSTPAPESRGDHAARHQPHPRAQAAVRNAERPAPITRPGEPKWTGPNGKQYTRGDLATSWTLRRAAANDRGILWHVVDLDKADLDQIAEDTQQLVEVIRAHDAAGTTE